MARTKKETKADEKLLVKVHKRYKLMWEADDHNREPNMEDFKFINLPGHQWEDNMKKERGKRPCYEFNKSRVTAKRIINDMKANPAQGKVRGVGNEDKGTAETIEGLIRNIWNVSNGETIVDDQSEYQVGFGMGAWRVATEHSDRTGFDLNLVIEDIPNPNCLYADPSAKDMLKTDADDWVLTEKISKAAFEQQYPNADKVDFEIENTDDAEDWEDDESVRVAEYWFKKPVEKEIWQLVDGKVIDPESDEGLVIAQTPDAIKKRRIIETDEIWMAIVSGNAVLEQPAKQVGSMHPFIMCYGEYVIVDGKIWWYGIGKFIKDAQRSYNISRTAISETIAMAPQAKWWATTIQAEGNTTKWAEAHQKNFPFLTYTPDPLSPGPPQRMGGADVPIALIQESRIASEEINMVSGIFAADVGAANQATSGRQEIARQQQGQIATFNYQDNRGKAIQRTWEILINYIPEVYDTERELRILGADDSETYEMVNSFVRDEEGNSVKINDMSVGQYDVTVTLGPNFSTRRQEASETYQTLMQGNPVLGQVAGDLIMKSMDLPYSEEIAERLKAVLPPEIQQMVNEDEDIPPEVQAVMAQAEQAMALVEQQAQEVQAAAQQTELDKAEVEKLIANLKTEEAQFEAKIAKALADITAKESGLAIKEVQLAREDFVNEGQDEIEEKREEVNVQLASDMAEAIQVIQQMAAQFTQLAVQALADIKESSDKKPKLIRVDLERKNGKASAVPVFEEEKTE